MLAVLLALLCFVGSQADVSGRRVPRVIYQTWLSKLVPLGFQIVRSRMLARNPGYKVVIFDDADINSYVAEHFSGTDTLRAFNQLKVGAARADLWRYLVLYREGGIYLDLDAEIVTPIDELVHDDEGALVSREETPHFMVQYMLVFEPGHPILARAIELSTRAILDGPEIPKGDDAWILDPVLYMAGPPIFNRAVDEVARTALGKSYPWSVWDATDAEVNPGLKLALRTRMLGMHYEGAVVPKHEYDSHRYWFAPGWRNSHEWSGGALVTMSLVAACGFSLLAICRTRGGRDALFSLARSWVGVIVTVFALLALFTWLILRGFIQVL